MRDKNSSSTILLFSIASFVIFSLFYYSDKTSISTDWRGYFLVFTPKCWLATIIALTLAFAVVHMIAKSPKINLVDSLSFSIASFLVRELDQNFVPSSNRISMRIVCFTVMMSGFIVYSAYTATMTSFLSISLNTPTIATFEDVANSGKTCLPLIVSVG